MVDMIPLNAVRAAIDAISTGRPANALENLRVLEMHLRAQTGVVPMILHCPCCQLQHIDAPEPHEVIGAEDRTHESGWTNPPHRSHLCAGCGYIWRPADVPTTGVAAITTRGQNDTDFISMPVFNPAQVERAARTPMPGGAQAWHWVFGGGRKITQDHLDWFQRVLSFGACGVLANPERDRSLAAAQEAANDLSIKLQELIGFNEWRWVHEEGRPMSNWTRGAKPPVEEISDSRGKMTVETRHVKANSRSEPKAPPG